MKRVVFLLLASLAVLAAAAAVFFVAKVREESAVVRAFAEDATRGIEHSDPEALALAIAGQVYRRTNRVIRAEDLGLYDLVESASTFNVSSAVSLRHGAYGLAGHSQLGPCGTMTRVTMAALRHVGVRARKLQIISNDTRLGSHAMLEFESHGRWLVLSPSDGAFVWRTREGRIATLDEIRADPAVHSQIFARYPHYPYRFDHVAHIRWAKLPAPIRGFARLLLGQPGYDSAQTPEFYDRPRELFLWTSLIGCAGFLLAALVIRASERTPEAPATTMSEAA